MAKKIHKYDGQDILVTYDVKRCIHAAECVHGLQAVFNTDKRPWVQPDQAEADAVAEVIQRCPTGALQFERKDGGPAEVVPDENRVVPDPDGPLYLHGDIEVLATDGSLLLKDTRVALCRCGASENKPFCDGAHHKVVFMDAGHLGENKLGDADGSNGTLQVQTTENGPLLLQGQVILQGADEETVYNGSKGALCRCGQSKNKPFCDGSHKQAKFQAP